MTTMTTMTTGNDTQNANLAVAHLWMTTIGEPEWWKLVHDDIVLEFPYGSSVGIKDRYVGKEEVVPYMRALFARLGVFKFINLQTIGTTDPELFVSEYDADMKTPHGETYVQTYINKIRVKDGKVILMREFWDPKRTIDATNGTFHL